MFDSKASVLSPVFVLYFLLFFAKKVAQNIMLFLHYFSQLPLTKVVYCNLNLLTKNSQGE